MHPGGRWFFAQAQAVFRSKKRSRATGHLDEKIRPSSLKRRLATVREWELPAASPLTRDEVLSRSEYDPSGPVETKVVEEVFVRSAFVLHLHVGGQIIRTTSEHPFFVEGQGWLPASKLKVGDLLLSADGQRVAVTDLCATGEYERVYNLRVAEYHTYFVGEWEWGFSVWSHNLCGDVVQTALTWVGLPRIVDVAASTIGGLADSGAANRSEIIRQLTAAGVGSSQVNQAADAIISAATAVNSGHTPIPGLPGGRDCSPVVRRATATDYEMVNLSKPNNFIIGELVSGGQLSFLIENLPKLSPQTGCPGQWMFQQMMMHFGNRVTAIQGNWISPTTSDNLIEINRLTTGNAISLEDAAWQTWTGRRARAYGFTQVEVVDTPIGTAGNYTSVHVLFKR